MSNSTDLVSIGIASFNNSDYLLRTLDSINSQTYHPIELIIVDDKSTDNSVEIIEKWISEYSGRLSIKFVKNPENKGITKTCNVILNQVTGKYFSAFSSDDIMLPNKIELLLNAFKKCGPEFAGVFSQVEIVDENDNKKGEFIPAKNNSFNLNTKEDLLKELSNYIVIPHIATLFETEKVKEVGGFNEKYWYEDHDLFLRIAAKYNIAYVPEVTVYYRKHSSQAKSKFSPIINTDKCRLLFSHYKLHKQYKALFKTGIRRPLRHLALDPGKKSMGVIKLYLKYIFEFKDPKGVALLIQYLTGIKFV